MELIRCRRSRRAFRDKPVDRKDIEKILEAARFAPSGHNEQSTEFIALQDQKTIDEITALTADYLGKLAKNTGNPIARFFMRREIGKRGLATLTKLAPELKGLADLYEIGYSNLKYKNWPERKPARVQWLGFD